MPTFFWPRVASSVCGTQSLKENSSEKLVFVLKFSYTFIFFVAQNPLTSFIYWLQDFVFLLLNIFTRFGIEIGMSKQLTGPSISNDHPMSIICKRIGANSCNTLLELLPIISLALVVYIILKCISNAICQRFLKYFALFGTILSYMSIAFHWASESTLFSHIEPIREFGRSLAPHIVYAIGGLSLCISALYRLLSRTEYLKTDKRLTNLSVAMLCSWSPTILILLGRQGPFVALICVTGGTVQTILFSILKNLLSLISPIPTYILQFGVSQNYSINIRENQNVTYLKSVLLILFRLFSGAFLQFVSFI